MYCELNYDLSVFTELNKIQQLLSTAHNIPVNSRVDRLKIRLNTEK